MPIKPHSRLDWSDRPLEPTHGGAKRHFTEFWAFPSAPQTGWILEDAYTWRGRVLMVRVATRHCSAHTNCHTGAPRQAIPEQRRFVILIWHALSNWLKRVLGSPKCHYGADYKAKREWQCLTPKRAYLISHLPSWYDQRHQQSYRWSGNPYCYRNRAGTSPAGALSCYLGFGRHLIHTNQPVWGQF